jgi:hypothetical protein
MKASPSSPSNKSRTDGIVKSIHSSIINLHQLGYNLAVNMSALLAANKKIVYGYATKKGMADQAHVLNSRGQKGVPWLK